MKLRWPWWPLIFAGVSALAQEATVSPSPAEDLAENPSPATTSAPGLTITPLTVATSSSSSSLPAETSPSAMTKTTTTSSSPSSSSSAESLAASSPGVSTEKEQAQLAAEQEWVNFKAIQKVLQNDQLASPAQRQQQAMQRSKQRQQYLAKALYDIPTAEHFWGFFSEFWLVKNVNILQWDVPMPDYAIETHFTAWLKQLKFPPLKFKLLLLDSINVCHVALPSDPGEVIFLLSVPFIRTLDLSQTEISVLLLEDLVRHQQGYLREMLSTPDAQKLWGTNFKTNPKFQGKFVGALLQRLDEVTMGTGFNFQQQFVVTNALRELIKGEDKLLYAYQSVLQKIDNLVKNNPKYKNYLNIYPSPELQLGWLNPQKVKHLE